MQQSLLTTYQDVTCAFISTTKQVTSQHFEESGPPKELNAAVVKGE